MKKTYILSLLHDTCLDKIEYREKIIELMFSFLLDEDAVYNVNLICKNVSNINCIEYFENGSENKINFNKLKEIDCLKAELIKDKLKLLFEDIDRRTIIELTFIIDNIEFTGNIKELKNFWSEEEIQI